MAINWPTTAALSSGKHESVHISLSSLSIFSINSSIFRQLFPSPIAEQIKEVIIDLSTCGEDSRVIRLFREIYRLFPLRRFVLNIEDGYYPLFLEVDMFTPKAEIVIGGFE